MAHRDDDPFIDSLAQQGIAYVAFFPLGGFTPLQSSALDRVAASMQTTSTQVALAWLLQRSPNILLIPGTSSIEHLRENLRAAALELPSNAITELDAVANALPRLSQCRDLVGLSPDVAILKLGNRQAPTEG